jgi:hypothetical protein
MAGLTKIEGEAPRENEWDWLRSLEILFVGKLPRFANKDRILLFQFAMSRRK